MFPDPTVIASRGLCCPVRALPLVSAMAAKDSKEKDKDKDKATWYYKKVVCFLFPCSPAPQLKRSGLLCCVQDLRFKGNKGWSAYSDEFSATIEAGYQAKEKTITLNKTWQIDYAEGIQYRIADRSRWRPIKRVLDKHKHKGQTQTKLTCCVHGSLLCCVLRDAEIEDEEAGESDGGAASDEEADAKPKGKKAAKGKKAKGKGKKKAKGDEDAEEEEEEEDEKKNKKKKAASSSSSSSSSAADAGAAGAGAGVSAEEVDKLKAELEKAKTEMAEWKQVCVFAVKSQRLLSKHLK